MTRNYNPLQYWQERGRHYQVLSDYADEKEVIRLTLERLVPASILEVGAGWGRVYAYLQSVSSPLAARLRMCDFVESMLDGCERETGVRPDLWDGHTLPYADGAFDLVLSVAVLQHVPPADLKHVLSEHVRVARRWLYLTTLVKLDGKPRRTITTWVHNYDALFAAFDLSVYRVAHLYQGLIVSEEEAARVHWLLEKPQ